MNRRQLLGLLAAAPAALIVPELLVPRRTFFLSPVGGWVASAEHTVTMTVGWTVEYVCIRPGIWQRIGFGVPPAVNEAILLDKKAGVPGEWVRYHGCCEDKLLLVIDNRRSPIAEEMLESELYFYSRSIEDVKIA